MNLKQKKQIKDGLPFRLLFDPKYFFLMRINLFLDAIFFDASPIKQYTPPINEQPASKHKQLGTVSETSSKVGWRTSSVSLLCMTSLEWIF